MQSKMLSHKMLTIERDKEETEKSEYETITFALSFSSSIAQ